MRHLEGIEVSGKVITCVTAHPVMNNCAIFCCFCVLDSALRIPLLINRRSSLKGVMLGQSFVPTVFFLAGIKFFLL